MVIFPYNAEQGGVWRNEDTDPVNYNDSAGSSPSDNGMCTGGAGVNEGRVRSGRTSRDNRRSRQTTRDSRGVRHSDSRVYQANLGSSGVPGRLHSVATDSESHSGLEGYGRYVGVPGDSGSFDSVFSEMETSDYSQHNMEISRDAHEAERSSSFSSLDESLAGYARYLGSSLVPVGNERALPNGNSRRQNYSAGRSFEISASSLSDYAGLGSYGQPYIEDESMEISRGQRRDNDLTYSDHYGYGTDY